MKMIHILSIDVEGFDLNVLRGGQTILPNVQVLEFEYHRAWGDDKSLVTALDIVERNGFVCYWPGSQGEIWRLSGCWQNHYTTHKATSNVLCVNAKYGQSDLVQPLVTLLEERFEQTLQNGTHG